MLHGLASQVEYTVGKKHFNRPALKNCSFMVAGPSILSLCFTKLIKNKREMDFEIFFTIEPKKNMVGPFLMSRSDNHKPIIFLRMA